MTLQRNPLPKSPNPKKSNKEKEAAAKFAYFIKKQGFQSEKALFCFYKKFANNRSLSATSVKKFSLGIDFDTLM